MAEWSPSMQICGAGHRRCAAAAVNVAVREGYHRRGTFIAHWSSLREPMEDTWTIEDTTDRILAAVVAVIAVGAVAIGFSGHETPWS